MTSERTITLTQREFVLIRVALIMRLEQLYGRVDCQSSYDETRALLAEGGKLALQKRETDH